MHFTFYVLKKRYGNSLNSQGLITKRTNCEVVTNVPSKKRKCAVPPDHFRSKISFMRNCSIPNIMPYVYRTAFVTLETLNWLCVYMVAQFHAHQNKHLHSVKLSQGNTGDHPTTELSTALVVFSRQNNFCRQASISTSINLRRTAYYAVACPLLKTAFIEKLALPYVAHASANIPATVAVSLSSETRVACKRDISFLPPKRSFGPETVSLMLGGSTIPNWLTALRNVPSVVITAKHNSVVTCTSDLYVAYVAQGITITPPPPLRPV